MTRRTLLQRAAALGLAGAVLGGGALWLGRSRTNRYYEGPVRDHFDGTRFHLPGAPEPAGAGDLLRWQLSGDRAPWPDRDPSPHRDRPPRRVQGRDLRVSYVGHASFLLQTGGLNILFDPVWSERASPVAFAGPRRVNDPGIAFADLPPIDAVLVTHNHYDHLDLATLGALRAAHRPRFVVPLGNDTILRSGVGDAEVVALDWGDRFDLSSAVRVHLVPAVHWSARGWSDRRHALWGSFVVETPGGALYLVGDTGFGDGSTFHQVGLRFPEIRLALLPIGAYEPRWFMQGQHVNPDEALRALQLCGAERAVAHHWGTFQLTDEAVRQPVVDLGEALARRQVHAERFLVLRPGQTLDPGRS